MMAGCLKQVRTPHLSMDWRVGSILPKLRSLRVAAAAARFGSPSDSGLQELGVLRVNRCLSSFRAPAMGDSVCHRLGRLWHLRLVRAGSIGHTKCTKCTVTSYLELTPFLRHVRVGSPTFPP